MARRLGNSDRQRERATQQALQARVANRFEVSIRRQISGAMRDAARAFEQGGGIAQAVRSHGPALERIMIADWTQAARLFGGRILQQAKSRRDGWTRKQSVDDVFDNAVSLFVRNLTAGKVVEINSTTEAQLKKIISAGFSDGLGVDAIARQIRSQTPIRAALRAHVIARTETHSAAGFGSQTAAETTGLPLRKEWIAAGDDRTRDDVFDHIGADRETVGMNDHFTLTGESLMYPGDPAGSPGNVIMCRCAAGYLFEE